MKVSHSKVKTEDGYITKGIKEMTVTKIEL